MRPRGIHPQRNGTATSGALDGAARELTRIQGILVTTWSRLSPPCFPCLPLSSEGAACRGMKILCSTPRLPPPSILLGVPFGPVFREGDGFALFEREVSAGRGRWATRAAAMLLSSLGRDWINLTTPTGPKTPQRPPNRRTPTINEKTIHVSVQDTTVRDRTLRLVNHHLEPDLSCRNQTTG